MQILKSMIAVLMISALSSAVSAQTLGVGTMQAGSLYHRTATAVAKLMNQKMGVKARIQPFSGSSTYIPLLNADEVQVAMVSVTDAVNAYKGTSNFAGRPQPNLRLLSVMFPLPFGVLVAADSPVKKIADLKGLRMPSHFTSQTTVVGNQLAVLATGGLTQADLKTYPVPNIFKVVDALADGKVEATAAAAGIAVVQKAHLKLRRRGGVRFIAIGTDPKAVAAMQKIVPSRPLILKPAGHLPGVVEPTAFMAFFTFLAANAKVSDELAYNIVKTVHANKPELVKASKILGRFNPGAMTLKMETPYHPGAIKFYKEIGQWPPK